jgi:hypothetical protein
MESEPSMTFWRMAVSGDDTASLTKLWFPASAIDHLSASPDNRAYG